MTSNNQQSKIINIFEVDPKDFAIDIGATTEYDSGTVKVALAPVTHKGERVFFMQGINESRSPFGISQDQQKSDKHTLTLNVEAKDDGQKEMVDAYMAKHNAIDDWLTADLAGKSGDDKWWGSKQDEQMLKFSRTGTIRDGGISREKKKPFPPSIKFAIANNRETKQAMFDAFIIDPETGQATKFQGNVLDSIPRNSEVTAFYGYPQIWKSNDKSWGIRWKIVQVYRHRISSMGIQLPSGMLMSGFAPPPSSTPSSTTTTTTVPEPMDTGDDGTEVY